MYDDACIDHSIPYIVDTYTFSIHTENKMATTFLLYTYKRI